MAWEKASAKNWKPVGQVPGVSPKVPANNSSVLGKPAIPSWNPPPKSNVSQGSSLPLSIKPTAPKVETVIETPLPTKPKAVLRTAAGQLWEDSTLLDWDTSTNARCNLFTKFE